MKKDLQLEQFSGPLDLLLSLISENQLDISQIAISKVTEQYLDYLSQLDESKAEELADFLVVASKLLLMKARKLMPQFALAEEEGPSLEDQLRLYKLFVDASRKINSLWDQPQRGFFRVEPPRKAEGFVWPENVDPQAMKETFLHLLSRLKPPKDLPQAYIDKAISMKEKIDTIRNLLKKRKKAYFFDVLDQAQNKTEIIVSFLAILELVKQRTVFLSQDSTFGDIAMEAVRDEKELI